MFIIRAVRSALFVSLTLMAESVAASTTVYGPKAYTVTHGSKESFADTFALADMDKCGGKVTYLLAVQNGDDHGAFRASSAEIALNGVSLFQANDFNQRVSALQSVVPLLATNALNVTITGGPGATLTLSVLKILDEAVGQDNLYSLPANGKQTFTENVAISNPAQQFTAVARVGDSAGAHIPAALSIRLNGLEVINKTDFHDGMLTIRKPVTLTLTNAVVTEVDGKAGDLVTLAFRHELPDSTCGPRVFFSSPSEGALISHSRIAVSGTAIGKTDLGITVNGFAAEIDLRHAGTPEDPFQWYSLVRPDHDGPFTLEAIATDSRGSTDRKTRAVSVALPSSSVELRPTFFGGIAPLTVSFSVVANVPEGSVGFDFDLDGDGVFETSYLPDAIPEDLSATYTEPGFHTATVRVRKADGSTLSDSVTIASQPFTVVNGLLTQQWSRFVDTLATGDVTAALEQFSPASRPRHAAAFQLIAPSLASFASGLRQLEPIGITGNTAHYLLTRMEDGHLRGYHVYLARDAKGIWRIVDF